MGIAVIGLFTGAPVLFFAGMGVAAYTWFTRPRRYLIYTNALVIEYGRPRVKIIRFSEISHLEMLSFFGDRLRVVMLNDRRTMIMTRNLDTFREKLDEALESYQSNYPDGERQDAAPNPRIIEQATEQQQRTSASGETATTNPDKKPRGLHRDKL